MERLEQFKHGLEETWQGIADGWRRLRDRAAGALTRFNPTRHGSPESGDTVVGAPDWAVLAGDVVEEQDRFRVRIEIPGMNKEDFEVDVRDDVLYVRGEKRMSEERTEGHYHIRQCAYGSFQRIIPLPGPVLADKASANYRRGVLSIELPRAEDRRGKRLPIDGD
ncbi:Hsp20/alpha crystallin family protein [Azoarcus taiwanensis]|uniref:Hsp20 family protein n=1 Tax=Azoarcus taiwanensis TaxID=666964 RepID=A0A972F9M3_9RHOO|nr:Hsp20/alpha crystallin family protein [Azoarcus taiwanensis]NMG04871.1 Hsp20 family protein [Azoarcus taiwanensis]